MQVNGVKQTEEHQRLTQVIKGVHRQLRQKVKDCDDVDCVWTTHCLNESGQLTRYAAAMHQLATEIWPQNNAETRIDWCYKSCVEYFFGGGLEHIRAKAARRQEYWRHAGDSCDTLKINSDNIDTVVDRVKCDLPASGAETHNLVTAVGSSESDSAKSSITVRLPFCRKVRLLDVGSCYNPFKAFPELLPIGIDICPAIPGVFKSDLLNMTITAALPSDEEVDSYFESLLETNSEGCKLLDSFVGGSCHVVVFSLLLEYLPTSRQRVTCSQIAWRLLVVDGLLLIVTPDSRHQHRNRRFARHWRQTIESVGFARWRYEKLQHLHCMAFRKLARDDNSPGLTLCVDSGLSIPQDDENCEAVTTLFQTGQNNVDELRPCSALLDSFTNFF